jgi:hypothetical protein
MTAYIAVNSAPQNRAIGRCDVDRRSGLPSIPAVRRGPRTAGVAPGRLGLHLNAPFAVSSAPPASHRAVRAPSQCERRAVRWRSRGGPALPSMPAVRVHPSRRREPAAELGARPNDDEPPKGRLV